MEPRITVTRTKDSDTGLQNGFALAERENPARPSRSYERRGMSCWDKEQLENMLEDVINELDLSAEMIEKHGPLGTPPADLVREVLEQKDWQIELLEKGFIHVRSLET